MSVRTTAPDDGSPAKRRRSRAPLPVILRLCTDLPANDNHPLARLDPAQRAEQRQRLIASILARLASGPSSIPMGVDTMRESRTDADGDKDTNEAE